MTEKEKDNILARARELSEAVSLADAKLNLCYIQGGDSEREWKLRGEYKRTLKAFDDYTSRDDYKEAVKLDTL